MRLHRIVILRRGLVDLGDRPFRCRQPSDLFSYSFDQLTRAVGGLLDRAIAAGEIREDISPEDLIRALVGMCYMHDQPGWQKSVLRLLDVFVDGLRVHMNADRPTTSLSPPRVKASAKRKPRRHGSPKRGK